MATKLDQSLEDILTTNRKSNPRARGRRVSKGTKARTAAPVGGIKKSVKSTAKAIVPTGPALKGESKVIVSNLPHDVSESQVKDYFTQAVGPVKRVQITYGPNGVSRGISTVVFHKGDAAAKALKAMDGVKVDGRMVKVEVVLDAKHAPPPAPIKELRDRISAPKATPKPATDKPKSAANGASGRGRGRGGRGRGGRGATGRRKPKTAEELDVEMDDYFGGGPAATEGAGAEAAPATNGDGGMDEVL